VVSNLTVIEAATRLQHICSTSAAHLRHERSGTSVRSGYERSE